MCSLTKVHILCRQQYAHSAAPFFVNNVLYYSTCTMCIVGMCTMFTMCTILYVYCYCTHSKYSSIYVHIVVLCVCISAVIQNSGTYITRFLFCNVQYRIFKQISPYFSISFCNCSINLPPLCKLFSVHSAVQAIFTDYSEVANVPDSPR